MHYCNSHNLKKLVPGGTSWGLRGDAAAGTPIQPLSWTIHEDKGDSSSMGVPEGDAVGLLLQEGSIKHVRCEDEHG